MLIAIATTAARQAPHLRQLRQLASSPGSVAAAVPPARLAECLSLAARPVRPTHPTHDHGARLAVRYAVFLSRPQARRPHSEKIVLFPARLLGRLAAGRAQGRGNACGGGRKKDIGPQPGRPRFRPHRSKSSCLLVNPCVGRGARKKGGPACHSRVIHPLDWFALVLTAARWLLSRRRGAV